MIAQAACLSRSRLFVSPAGSHSCNCCWCAFVVCVSQLPGGGDGCFLHPDDSAVVHQGARLCSWMDFSLWKVGAADAATQPQKLCAVFFFYIFLLLWQTQTHINENCDMGVVKGFNGFPVRKGYRTDATVSVLLGFLLFLIPARRPFSSSSCRNPGVWHEGNWSLGHLENILLHLRG